MRSARDEGWRGFTLLEVLLALSVTLVALLLSTAFLAQQPRLIQRLEAQRGADRALEAAAESLRGGQLALQSGTPQWLGPPPPGLTRFQLQVAVSDASVPDLYDVVLTAVYTVEGQPQQRQLSTRVWRP